MEVAVTLASAPDQDEGALASQVLVESGHVASINVAYRLMGQISRQAGRDLIDIPDRATAAAHFTVKYFSVGGVRTVETDCNFWFMVGEDRIFVFTSIEGLRTTARADYSARQDG
jgi:hypothetical protein